MIYTGYWLLCELIDCCVGAVAVLGDLGAVGLGFFGVYWGFEGALALLDLFLGEACTL